MKASTRSRTVSSPSGTDVSPSSPGSLGRHGARTTLGILVNNVCILQKLLFFPITTNQITTITQIVSSNHYNCLIKHVSSHIKHYFDIPPHNVESGMPRVLVCASPEGSCSRNSAASFLGSWRSRSTMGTRVQMPSLQCKRG